MTGTGWPADATGHEQEALRADQAALRAEVAALRVQQAQMREQLDLLLAATSPSAHDPAAFDPYGDPHPPSGLRKGLGNLIPRAV